MRTLAIVLGLAALPLASLAQEARISSVTPRAIVRVALPGDLQFSFKKGPGQEIASTHCLTCHSSAYVSTQPALDKEHWVAEVTKMRKAYGADITDADSETIATYLAIAYGSPAH